MSDDDYFDYAASAPPHPEALKRFEEVSLRHPSNPSSSHEGGRRAREALESARESLLSLAGLPDGSFVLTSGATEANNLVIRSAMDAGADGRVVLAADVHPSAWFARDLWPKRADVCETGPDGRLFLDRLAALLTKKTALVSVLHAGNETGVIHDLKAIGDLCARQGIPLHVDGVQALGRIPVALSDLRFAFYTFSAHKFGGPRGVGGVFLREAPPRPQILGGGQEDGARSGTENVAGLAAAAVALERSTSSLQSEVPLLRRLAGLLSGEIGGTIPGAILNSSEAGLPGLVSVSFPGLVGEEIVAEMSLRGFAISAGSACGSGRMEPSRPVMAMGRTREQALGTVRISMGRLTSEASVRRLSAALKQVIEKQKALA